MKKYLVYALIMVSVGILSSCSDFLDEQNPNTVPSNKYFTSENDVRKAVDGIYEALRSGSCLGEGSTLYGEERSDNTGRNDNQSNAGEPFQFNDFSLLPTNTFLKSHWSALYVVIARANFVLSYIDEVNFANPREKENYRSEALFCRALVYLHLVRKWGDVPMVTEYLQNYDDILKNTARTPKEAVYAQVATDLKSALNSDLPNIQSASGKGRTCKAAINGLLGQTYLTMGCVLADNKEQNFKSAKQYLEAAYAMRPYVRLAEVPYADVFDVDKKNNNKEAIFQIVYIQGDLNYSSSIARINQSAGERINSLYNSTGQGTFVKPDLVKEYEDGDIRKEFSVKYAQDSRAKAWFITKFRDTSVAAGANGRGGNDFILMRFADITLMLAEVNMYLNDEDKAIEYLDEVRERAGLLPYSESKKNRAYSSKFPTLKLAILHERRVELAFENQRLFDLLRFFNATEFVSYFHAKAQEDYGLSRLDNCGTKDIYYPIPFDEWKLNPENMYQNNGY